MIQYIAAGIWLWLVYVYIRTHQSMEVGATVMALTGIVWGPYLVSTDKQYVKELYHTLTNKVIPVYGEWIQASAGFLNVLIPAIVLSFCVGMLTVFNLTGGNAVYLYYILVIAMFISSFIIAVGAYVVGGRIKRMVFAHNIMTGLINTLNVMEEAELDDEEMSKAKEVIVASTDPTMWDSLITDNIVFT